MKDSAKRTWFIVAVGCALIAVVGLSRLLAPNEIIPWRTDFAAAKSESALRHKPIMAYFTADWCGPCQSLKRTIWADVAVEKALRSYVPVEINIDQHPDLAREYGADAIPKFVVLDQAGQVKRGRVGAISSAEFLDWLKE
jgi:thioredoxin-like negative regulator of GroEL